MTRNNNPGPDKKLPDMLNNLDINEFTYDLPDDRIARFPLDDRDRSKLLVSENGIISDTEFSKLPDLMPTDKLLVFNNSRVIRARLLFRKNSGAQIEVLCLEPADPADYERSFSSKKPVTWKCIVGNLKRWKNELLELPFRVEGNDYLLTAEKVNTNNDICEVRFSWTNTDLSFSDLLEIQGHVPLPPYLGREDNINDVSRYQTIYATVKGSVAAPTAGLHFTAKVLDRLKDKGIKSCEVTLHVGAGTFQPVKTDNALLHKMHSEQIYINRTTLTSLNEKQGNIIAVGTTSVRTLESLYWIGVKMLEQETVNGEPIHLGQWEAYKVKTSYTANEAIEAILDYMKKYNLDSIEASTQLMIIPGYRFRMVDGIITNFHQPGSTLLLLVAAWCGSKWKEIYRYAIDNKFRFLSYGDSSLMIRELTYK